MIHDDWQSIAPSAIAPSAIAPSAIAPSACAPTGPGITWLSDWGVAIFSGTDVQGFLQGYLTSDARALEARTLSPTALCNIKGRVVVNGWACGTPSAVTLIHHASLGGALASMLALYLKFSKATLANRSEQVLVFGALDLPPIAEALRLDARRQILLCNTVAGASALVANQPMISRDVWDSALIEDGIALLSEATRDTFLPQMLDLPRLGAVSFAKGCYLGQEIVARAQHRGQVKRHLVRLSWTGDAAPAPGSELLDAAGRARGQVVMASVQAPAAADAKDAVRAGSALAVLQDNSPFPLSCASAVFSESP